MFLSFQSHFSPEVTPSSAFMTHILLWDHSEIRHRSPDSHAQFFLLHPTDSSTSILIPRNHPLVWDLCSAWFMNIQYQSHIWELLLTVLYLRVSLINRHSAWEFTPYQPYNWRPPHFGFFFFSSHESSYLPSALFPLPSPIFPSLPFSCFLFPALSCPTLTHVPSPSLPFHLLPSLSTFSFLFFLLLVILNKEYVPPNQTGLNTRSTELSSQSAVKESEEQRG